MRRRRARFTAAVFGAVVLTALAACSSGGGLTQHYTEGGTSMEPTLRQGQTITVTAVGSGYVPHRGDLIVFKAPPGWLSGGGGSCGCMLKRVIGIPGDTVSAAGMGAPIEVNGAAVSEPYLYPGNNPSWQAFSATVPAGDLWVMGDHRDVSMDSRVHQAMNGQGFVPASNVTGVYRP